MICKYRKKPVVIEAIEWTGDNLKEVINFTSLNPSAIHWTWEQYEQIVETKGLRIFNSKGSYSASIGDMIIKNEQGEFYPYKPAELIKEKKNNETLKLWKVLHDNRLHIPIKECESVEYLRSTVEKLWNIIDDIDTYGNMTKDDDAAYRKLVEQRQAQRYTEADIYCDGHNIFREIKL